MDLSRLPRLKLHFFYHPFSPGVKGVFLTLTGILVLMGGYLLFAHANPNYWSLDVSEVQEPFTEEVPVQQIEHRYRTVELSLNAFRQWTTYSAGPIQPSALPFVLFLFAQLIAWSVLLAATTQIQSKWVYLFYLLFAFFIHFSEISSILYPEEVFHVLEGLILFCYLGLGYAFQMKVLRWNFLWRVISILGLSLIFFGYALAKGGWVVAHAINLNTFSYLAFLGIAFLFFIAKEPTNFILWSSTNHPRQNRRLRTWQILMICFVWLLMVLIWLDEYMNLYFLGDFRSGIRPFHVITLSAVMTVFFSQNHFHQVRNMFSSISNYTLILLSWAVITISYFFVNCTVGDPLFVYTMERIAVLFFLGIGFAHVFFIFTNHKPLLDQRAHLYYLLARGTNYSFAVVWMIGLIALIVGEGRDGWKSFNLLYQAEACHEADRHWLDNDLPKTIAAYERAILASEPSPKANYNLASLVLTDPDMLRQAVRYYEAAAELYQFPYALINASQLLQINRQPDQAEAMLRRGITALEPHPHVFNNLAVMYAKEASADSAIQYFKEALLKDLEASSVYANLAQVYWNNDRLGDAKAFFEAGLDTQSPSPAAYANAIAYSLAQAETWEGDFDELPETEDYVYAYNRQLLALENSPDQIDAVAVKALAVQKNAPDAIILDAYLMFLADSIEHAASRVSGLSASFPTYAGKANFMLGAAFLKEGIPEMARKYFRLAGEAGNPYGSLYEAKMNIDLGWADSANFQLSALRAAHEELWEPCAKELAMLLEAYGQGLYAQTEWDVRSLSLEEQVRISLYADSLQQFSLALENFRQIQDQDSTTLLPYLEMGRLYNKYRDPVAVSDIAYGLQKDENFQPLRLEYARALLYQGELDQVDEELAKLDVRGPLEADIRFLKAESSLAQQDTATALAQLDTLHQMRPMHQPTIVLLASLLLNKQELDLANAVITTAIERNTENPDLWYYYALLAREWNLPEDVGYGALKAIELSVSPQRRQDISDIFETEIRLVVQAE